MYVFSGESGPQIVKTGSREVEKADGSGIVVLHDYKHVHFSFECDECKKFVEVANQSMPNFYRPWLIMMPRPEDDLTFCCGKCQHTHGERVFGWKMED